MLKWYAETFKLSARELTASAISRIKLLTVLSLPALPLAMVDIFLEIPDHLTIPFWGILIPSLIAFVCLGCTKFVNRFFARDKYLDEWETAKKHQAMAFAFQVIAYSFSAVLVFGVLGDAFSIFHNMRTPSFDVYEIGVVAAGLMMFGFYAMHFFLLATVKPIDESDKDDALMKAV